MNLLTLVNTEIQISGVTLLSV